MDILCPGATHTRLSAGLLQLAPAHTGPTPAPHRICTLPLSPSRHTHSHQALPSRELIINRAGWGTRRWEATPRGSTWGRFMRLLPWRRRAGCKHSARAAMARAHTHTQSRMRSCGRGGGGNSEGTANRSHSPASQLPAALLPPPHHCLAHSLQAASREGRQPHEARSEGGAPAQERQTAWAGVGSGHAPSAGPADSPGHQGCGF